MAQKDILQSIKEKLLKQEKEKELEDTLKIIEKAIDNGKKEWKFQGDEEYINTLKKDLHSIGFKTIEKGYDRGFEASDPDGGQFNSAPFYFITVKFEYSGQID